MNPLLPSTSTMVSYLFDGHTRSKPYPDDFHHKRQFLDQVHEERSRRKKQHLRQEFDLAQRLPQSLAMLELQLKRFCHFGSETVDGARLEWLAEQVLARRAELVIAMQRESLTHSLVRFLVFCSRFCARTAANGKRSSSSREGQSQAKIPAIPMRCLETLLSPKYAEGKWHRVICHGLLKEGFLADLSSILVQNVPGDLLMAPTVKPPTPLAQTLRDMVLTVLLCCDSPQLMHSFTGTFLAPSPLAPVVEWYLLPSLASDPQFCVTEIFGFFANLETYNFLRETARTGLLENVLKMVKHMPKEVLNQCPPSTLAGAFCNLFTALRQLRIQSGFLDEEMPSPPPPLITLASEFLDDSAFCTALTQNATRDQLTRLLYSILHIQSLDSVRLLYTSCFDYDLLAWLRSKYLNSQEIAFSGVKRHLELLQIGNPVNSEDFLAYIHVFCALFSRVLIALTDAEFGHKMDTFDLPNLCRELRDAALGIINMQYPDFTLQPRFKASFGSFGQLTQSSGEAQISDKKDEAMQNLFKVVVSVLGLLHERDSRLGFCEAGSWIALPGQTRIDQKLFKSRGQTMKRLVNAGKEMEEGIDEPILLSAGEQRLVTILRNVPYTVPFVVRVELLNCLISEDKTENGITDGWRWDKSIQLRVRRTHLYEDAFDRLSPENVPNLRLPLRILMINWTGLDEAGIDGGGIFREFLNELIKEAFDPARGFFRTTDDGLLHPNPAAVTLFPDTAHKHYFFLGRLLAKAIYERMLIEVPFATFFLLKLLSKPATVHHLASLDKVLARNVLYLKSYNGDVSDLDLDFSINIEELGEVRTVELRPGGASIRVDNSNKLQYIHLLADFYLNKQMRHQTEWLRRGLADVLDLDWLQLFGPQELQALLSGADRDIDLADMRANVVYSGGYSNSHPTVEAFWRVMHNFSEADRRRLLKFATSCSRPPLLGFKDLFPPLNIQMVPSAERLPSASTCMNLLKLPDLPHEGQLAEKLKYAIEAGAGFELS